MDCYHCQQRKDQEYDPGVDQKNTKEQQIQKQVDRIARHSEDPGGHQRAWSSHVKADSPRVAKGDEGQDEYEKAHRY